MPKIEEKITYPPGCKEISQDLPTDDLVRRMKDIAMAFQQMSQEDDNSCYLNLACYLATDFFLEHPSRDVRLLVACAIADVFRVYAPNSPYQVPALVKKIFLFFIQQLKGLQDPKDATFKRYFYLLENLAWVKSFNICIELDDSQFIFCQLFSLIFKIVNDNHSEKVKNFMLDMLTPLIIEADTVSMKLIEIILWQIIEPKKSQNKQACWLATQILKKTIKTMEPYLISYFNKAIVHGMKSEGLGELSDDEDNPLAAQQAAKKIKSYKARNSKNAPNANTTISHLCELIYELNQICPSVMTGILPQLDFKIKSNEEKERCEFTRLLARLFSDKSSKLAEEFPDLWRSFLGRFRDISEIVRTRCVQYSMHFLVNHPSLRDDITEQLKQRQHDPTENVRYEVVMAIISAAKKGIENVNEDLLSFVKERTLDKKFKIRKEALFGMAFLYKQYNLNISSENDGDLSTTSQVNKPTTAIKMLDWIKNKCMHNYFQSSLMDRLLTEKIIHMFLIPYSAPLTQRMRILYCFYSTIDQHAARVFNELLKQQLMVRKQVKEVLDILKEEKSKERDELLEQKVQACAKSLPEPVKAQEYITKLCRNLELNPALRQHMEIIVTSTSYPQVSDEGTVLSPPQCSTIEISVKEVLKSLGYPVQTNSFYCIIKQLMERIAPVLIDYQGLIQLFDYVHDSLLGSGDYDSQFGLQNSSKRGLQLILGLSTVFPAIFYGKEIFTNYLLPFLWQTEQPEIGEVVLQILTNIGASMNYEGCNQEAIGTTPWWSGGDVIPKIIDSFILKASTSKQAKYAVQCLNSIVNDESEKNKMFSQIIDRIKTDGFSLESPHFRIHLVTTGMIAISGGYLFFPKQLKTIMYKHVVQNLLLKDQRLQEEIDLAERTEKQRATSDPSQTFEFLSEEVKCKIEAIKLMVRWIHGIKLSTLTAPPETQADEISKYHTVVENSMNLLMTIIKNGGDLNNNGVGGTTLERAHLRLAAGIAMIKIVANDSITQVTPTGSAAVMSSTENSTSIVQVPTSQLISPKQWHVLATLLLDSEDFVRERFAAKLNKNLITLSLSLEFLAMLCLAGYYDASSSFRNKLRTFLLWNLSKRRDTYKAKSNLNLKAILPECAMPYVIHLLAHVPFYTHHDDVSQLNIVKDCLWFFMEPLVLKNEYFSFSFYKKTFENIKVCVDKVSATRPPEVAEEEVANAIQSINFRIYSCCDLALGLIMSKTQNFLSREFPIQPSLPGKYFAVSKEAKENNLKNYLPPSMQFAPPKRCSLENEILSKITKSFPSSTSSPNQPTVRGRPTKNVNNNINQIVLVSTDDMVDSSVIDDGQANFIQLDQLDTDSNELQHIRIEDAMQINNGSAELIENDHQLNDKISGTSAPPIIVINPHQQNANIAVSSTVTNSAVAATTSTVNNNNTVANDNSTTNTNNNVSTTVTYSGTRSRKQDLNVLNDDHQPSKRQRLDSGSSNGAISPVTSKQTAGRPTRAGTRKSSQDLMENESNDVVVEDYDEDEVEDQPTTRGRRGRPAKTRSNSKTVSATKQTIDNDESNQANTRKSSRVTKATNNVQEEEVKATNGRSTRRALKRN